ncbi:MAG: DNA2/NAM7 family helicase [Bacteroidaceae bacterium]|nr:DNA2/NAM7 family helicase [Bacteroidaceae bacterium]
MVNLSRGDVPTAADYFDQLAEMRRKPATKELYHELYGMMRQLCDAHTDGQVFSNFFSQLGWVCESCSIPNDMSIALQELRHRVSLHDDVETRQLLQDIRLVAEFVGRLYGVVLPIELTSISLLPSSFPLKEGLGVVSEYALLRARVKDVGDDYLTVIADSEDARGDMLRVAYSDEEHDANRSYLKDIVHEGSTLSLLNLRLMHDTQCYVARWIVYEPDFLMSPSELAAVFELNAVMPENYFLRGLMPRESTFYTLLGNTSGQMLDDIVFQTPDHPATYADSVRKAFERYPLDFWLCMSDKDEAERFHREARVQFANIKQIVETQMEMVYGFDLSQAMLEPSFVRPAVGLSGRMDYLQMDGSRLIEQKSGKCDEYRHTHREPHFLQMMLYSLMLGRRCQPYLLYSRYADGLMLERPYIALLRQAMEMRNRIVALQERMAKGNVRLFFESMHVDDFRQRTISDKLWFDHIKPRIENLLMPFTKHTSESRSALDFFYRFYQFLTKEQWLARMGNGTGAHGYADLWNCPALVRIQNGDMYAGLKIKRLESSAAHGVGIDIVTFYIPEEQHQSAIITNFRLGDTVQAYAYKGEEPNVTQQFTLRARITRLTPCEVQIELNNAQRNMDVFGGEDTLFALEHDRVEAGNSLLISGLYSLLTSPLEVQDRFFLRNLAGPATEEALCGEYGAFHDLVAKAMAAKDLFLVIGPPGSGKTSCALRFMVEEALRCRSDSRFLLMAYTNRAVDELCAMLDDVIRDCPDLLSDYMRLGMGEKVSEMVSNVGDVDRLLAATRVMVGTTTTMTQRQQILGKLHFEIAFIDEASQILEPYLLPFFTIGTIDKFVLVGDQKQLPAVVMQRYDEAAITDTTLNDLGLINCACSVFDRMLHRLMAMGRNDLYVQIESQGRMHPDLYAFVNDSFYRGLLRSVPLHHQQRSLSEFYANIPTEGTDLMPWLAGERVLFVDCPPIDDGVNDKINSAEATIVAKCLTDITALYEANGRQLTADDVGVIVPYRNQIAMVRSKLHECGLHHLADAAIDTVERYQGSQRDIIIYSFTVRHVGQLGFLSSSTYIEDEDGSCEPYPVDRKLNVALTRAREQMVLVGNAPLLRRNHLFARLIEGTPVVTLGNK